MMTGNPRDRARRVVSFWTRGTRLERQLEAEVASRHHHRIAGLQNLVEAGDRFGAFELGDDRDVRGARLSQRISQLAKVGRALNEAHRHEIDAGSDAEPQVLGILRGQTRTREAPPRAR